MNGLHATMFHARTAEHNRGHVWARRGGFSVPAHYGDPQQEAMAARFSCVLADASALEELKIEGPGAAALLAAACGAPVRTLGAGRSRPVHWCADGGGLRGLGAVLRLAAHSFILRGVDTDAGWFATAAPRFGATVHDATPERGLLLVAGPFAGAVLATAELDGIAALEADEHAATGWHGVSIAANRDAALNGYLVSCPAEEGVVAFDRLFKAGAQYGMRLAGQEAVELLQLEAGLPLPHLDFQPARGSFDREPLPPSLGLATRIATEGRILAGIEFDSATPLSFAALFHDGTEIGRTLRSAYSPALRRAIALAQVDVAHTLPGTALTLRDGDKEIAARVAPLPFL
jgi:glycine cleavage system T protein (aminomethyltransferase)